MLYTVIRCDTHERFLNPTPITLNKAKLTSILKSYQTVFLIESLNDAIKIASSKSFCTQHQPPITMGTCGLVLQVNITVNAIPEKEYVDASEFFNAWVDSQSANSFKKESWHDVIECYQLLPNQITDILSATVPEKVSMCYPSLQSIEFTPLMSRGLAGSRPPSELTTTLRSFSL